MTTAVDVLIVGGGPAGSLAAASLAPLRSVVVVERSVDDAASEGETLAPAASRVLADAGLPTLLADDAHEATNLRRWSWGGTDQLDAIRDPEGPHRLIDRRRLDAALRANAVDRGATMLRGHRLVRLDRRSDGHAHRWALALVETSSGLGVEIDARLVIDASGRRRSVARALGVPTQSIDRLVSRWTIGRHRGARPGVTDVVADADGWWFSTALPGERRLLSWQTDADIMPSSTEIDLVASARRNDAMGAVIRDFLPDGAGGSRAAAMTRLEHVAGPGWLAAGDAAVALDPLSSQGLFAALFTGFAAAATAHDSLDGDTAASSDYERAVDAVWERNRVLLDATYAAERRWSDRPFWRRRHERATRCAATGVR